MDNFTQVTQKILSSGWKNTLMVKSIPQNIEGHWPLFIGKDVLTNKMQQEEKST